MFSFGDEADAKSAAAPSTAPHAEQDNSTSPVKQQAVQGAALASQEQSQTHDAKSQNQSSPKQDLANSSVHNLQQSAPAVPQQMTASTAEQAATFPLSDEQIIAKESSRTVDSDLLASGSAVRSGSNADARKSVSKAPSQRPSTSKPPIDAKTIAKYSHQAINPDLSAAASSTGASTSSVDTTKPASASSQRPSSTKPAIDPKIIAKYSRRSVTTALPASGSTGTSGSNVDAVKSVSNTSSQHPRSPAFGSTGPSSSDGDMSKSVSSQTPASPKPPIDDKIIAKYSGGAISPDLPAPGSTGPTGLKADTTKSGSKASKQRPASPQAPIDTKSVSKASSQRPGLSKPPIDNKSVSKASSKRPGSPKLPIDSKSVSKASSQRPASSKPPKPSREVVILDPPASKSESAEAETSVDTSDRTARGSESASERLGGMTPQQLEGLKVSLRCHCMAMCGFMYANITGICS